MKLSVILFAIACSLTCVSTSAKIDVDVLTRGGWETEDGAGIDFFNSDGTGVSCGYTVTPMNWSVDADGILKLTYDDDINEYVTEIKNGVMYWRNGAKSFSRPFAEVDNEISRREKHHFRENGWTAPNSANSLSEKLYGNCYVTNSLDKAIFFCSPDTCSISDFVLNDISRKYVWKAIDSESVRLTEIDAPYKNRMNKNSRLLKIKMYPEAFDLVEDSISNHFIINAFHDREASGVTNDLCLQPLGCSGFFTDGKDEVLSRIHDAFPESGINPYYSVFIGGRGWDCNGVKITSAERAVCYIHYPSDEDSADDSFKSMATLLGNKFQEVRSPLGEHTRMYVSPYYGSLDPDAEDVVITLIKSDPGEYLKNGCVTLDVRKK